MEITIKRKTSEKVSLIIDDQLVHELAPQIWMVLVRGKQILLEIKNHIQKDEKFAEKVINVVRDSDSPGSALTALEKKFELSNKTAEALLNSSLSDPIWNYEKRLAELEDLLKMLKCIQLEKEI